MLLLLVVLVRAHVETPVLATKCGSTGWLWVAVTARSQKAVSHCFGEERVPQPNRQYMESHGERKELHWRLFRNLNFQCFCSVKCFLFVDWMELKVDLWAKNMANHFYFIRAHTQTCKTCTFRYKSKPLRNSALAITICWSDYNYRLSHFFTSRGLCNRLPPIFSRSCTADSKW